MKLAENYYLGNPLERPAAHPDPHASQQCAVTAVGQSPAYDIIASSSDWQLFQFGASRPCQQPRTNLSGSTNRLGRGLYNSSHYSQKKVDDEIHTVSTQVSKNFIKWS